MNLRRKISQFLLVGLVEFLDEMIRQQIDILRSVFDWRDHDSRDRKTVKQIFAQLIFCRAICGIVLILLMIRTSTLISQPPPRRRISFSSRTRSSFACDSRLIELISSRNNVPPSACSNRPILSRAPVKAPGSFRRGSLPEGRQVRRRS